MGQAQINVRTRACSTTSIARTKQAALTHNVRGKELIRYLGSHMWSAELFGSASDNNYGTWRHGDVPGTPAIYGVISRLIYGIKPDH